MTSNKTDNTASNESVNAFIIKYVKQVNSDFFKTPKFKTFTKEKQKDNINSLAEKTNNIYDMLEDPYISILIKMVFCAGRLAEQAEPTKPDKETHKIDIQ